MKNKQRNCLKSVFKNSFLETHFEKLFFKSLFSILYFKWMSKNHFVFYISK